MTVIYSYLDFTSEEADSSLWDQVQDALNGTLSPYDFNSFKHGSSDIQGADARALVIYCSQGEDPGEDTLTNLWYYQDFTTSDDYQNMYQQCINFLNGTTLTAAQKFYSRICMTDSNGNDAHLVLWYRDSQ